MTSITSSAVIAAIAGTGCCWGFSHPPGQHSGLLVSRREDGHPRAALLVLGCHTNGSPVAEQLAQGRPQQHCLLVPAGAARRDPRVTQ